MKHFQKLINIHHKKHLKKLIATLRPIHSPSSTVRLIVKAPSRNKANYTRSSTNLFKKTIIINYMLFEPKSQINQIVIRCTSPRLGQDMWLCELARKKFCFKSLYQTEAILISNQKSYIIQLWDSWNLYDHHLFPMSKT